MTTIKSFGSMELALKALLIAKYPPLAQLPAFEADARVGGDLAFEPALGWYVRIDKVDQNVDRLEGDFIMDVEVFGVNYLATESHALDIEALLLGYPHVVEVGGRTVVFDSVTQNAGPDDLPWEDDGVHRLGATYVITARRR